MGTEQGVVGSTDDRTIHLDVNGLKGRREFGEARGTSALQGKSWRRVHNHSRTPRRRSALWAHVLENGLRQRGARGYVEISTKTHHC